MQNISKGSESVFPLSTAAGEATAIGERKSNPSRRRTNEWAYIFVSQNIEGGQLMALYGEYIFVSQTIGVAWGMAWIGTS